VKWEKENLDDPPQSKVKRFHSDSEVEPKERKEKKRKQEQKGISQVSLVHNIVNKQQMQG
jgi:hypothetical protein